MRLNSLLILLLAGTLSGCSMPRIIVLNDPLDARQHNDLGVSYEQRQEYDLALREYRRAAELDEDWSLPLFNRGNVYAKLEQWPEAIGAYRAALGIDPQAAQVANNLAWVLVKTGELAEGITMAERAVALNSDDPSYWDTLATAYLLAGRLKASDAAARSGLALTPAPQLQESLQAKLLSAAEP